MYARKVRKVDADRGDERPAPLIVAENDSAEFVSNQDESQQASGCYYLLAVRKPSSSTLTVLPTPLYPHIISAPTVKALKPKKEALQGSPDDYFLAKNSLGETFGSKKAQAAIRQRARNKVDVTAMEGVVGHLMDGIEKGSEGLMTKGTSPSTFTLLVEDLFLFYRRSAGGCERSATHTTS